MKKYLTPDSLHKLRVSAESQLELGKPVLPLSAMEDLLHELRVYQIELEMQNDELRASQIALEVSREHYTDFYDFSSVGFMTLTAQGLISDINLTGAMMLGVERTKLQKQLFTTFVAAEDADRWYMHFISVMQLETKANCELTLQRRDGTRCYCRLDFIRITKNEEAPVLRIVFADISEQIQAENRFRNVIEAAPNAMIIVNDRSEITLINAETSAMFGYAKDELIGRSINCLLPAEHHHAHAAYIKNFMLNAPVQRKMGLGRELFGQHKDGHKIPVEVGLSPMQTREGNFVIATLIDIAERKQREREALQLREQIAQATKMESIGHLTAGIAHDFNNILGAMMGYTELTLHLLASGKTQSLDRYQEEILKAGNRAKELIAQMLTFSRLSPEVKGQPAPVTILATIIKEVASLLRSSIPSTIEINYRIASEVLKAKILPIHLHQIILNLGINARDAIGEYGKIDISLQEQHVGNKLCSSCNMLFTGDYAQISVKDSGSGIPEHVMKMIFDPFFTTKGIGKGTGMGLSVVHGLVHAQGGHIQLGSNAGGGTIFNILLPLQSSDATAHVLSEPALPVDITGARIMVVDDEPALTCMLYEFLSHHGAHIVAFNDPILALEAYIKNAANIDLVISDETMPGMSGMLLAEKMLKLNSFLPIILCTGYSEHATHESIVNTGIAGYFQKPVNMDELLNKIQALWKVRRK